MSDPAPSFVSVKLPASLVQQARVSAQTMRRSVASQIEYWATLGKALEQAGLTTNDSQALIARQERAAYGAALPPLGQELDELHGHVVALAKSGALNARVREAVNVNTAAGATGATGARVTSGTSDGSTISGGAGGHAAKPARRARKAP
jgi:hypothetical protein